MAKDSTAKDYTQDYPHRVGRAVFGCAFDWCREEVSYEPNELGWHEGGPEGGPGWYCVNCMDQLDSPDGCGKAIIRMDEFLKKEFAETVRKFVATNVISMVSIVKFDPDELAKLLFRIIQGKHLR